VPVTGGRPPGSTLRSSRREVRSFWVSSSGARVVYLADQRQDEVFELYSVPSAAVITKLNGPLVAAGRLLLPPWPRRRPRRVRRRPADRRVPSSTVSHRGGVVAKLNAPSAKAAASGTPTSARRRFVFFQSNQQNSRPGTLQGSGCGGAALRLNGPIIAGATSTTASISDQPSGNHVVYMADQLTDNTPELFEAHEEWSVRLPSRVPRTGGCSSPPKPRRRRQRGRRGTLRLGDDASDRQYRSILSFDTASLPENAVVLDATLLLRSPASAAPTRSSRTAASSWTCGGPFSDSAP